MNPALSSFATADEEPSEKTSGLTAAGPAVSALTRTGLAIRQATPGDAGVVARIQVETWRSAYRGIIPRVHLDSLSVAQRELGWQKNLSENRTTVLIAARDDAIAGWISFGRCRDQGQMHQAEIHAIYVDPAHQRTGVGGTLLWMAERQIAAECTRVRSRISLWVLERNHAARWFYERRGYARGVWEKQEQIGGGWFTELRYEKEIFRPSASTQ